MLKNRPTFFEIRLVDFLIWQLDISRSALAQWSCLAKSFDCCLYAGQLQPKETQLVNYEYTKGQARTLTSVKTWILSSPVQFAAFSNRLTITIFNWLGEEIFVTRLVGPFPQYFVTLLRGPHLPECRGILLNLLSPRPSHSTTNNMFLHLLVIIAFAMPCVWFEKHICCVQSISKCFTLAPVTSTWMWSKLSSKHRASELSVLDTFAPTVVIPRAKASTKVKLSWTPYW